MALQWVGQRLYLALAVKMICTGAGKFHTPLGWVVGVRWRADKFIKGVGLVVLGLAVTPGLETLIPALLIPLSFGGQAASRMDGFAGSLVRPYRMPAAWDGVGRSGLAKGLFNIVYIIF